MCPQKDASAHVCCECVVCGLCVVCECGVWSVCCVCIADWLMPWLQFAGGTDDPVQIWARRKGRAAWVDNAYHTWSEVWLPDFVSYLIKQFNYRALGVRHLHEVTILYSYPTSIETLVKYHRHPFLSPKSTQEDSTLQPSWLLVLPWQSQSYPSIPFPPTDRHNTELLNHVNLNFAKNIFFLAVTHVSQSFYTNLIDDGRFSDDLTWNDPAEDFTASRFKAHQYKLTQPNQKLLYSRPIPSQWRSAPQTTNTRRS